MRIGKPKPYNGEKRTRVVFAWYPIRCNDGYRYWLERIEVTEEWVDILNEWRRRTAAPCSEEGETWS